MTDLKQSQVYVYLRFLKELSGKLEHLFLSSRFLEITSHIVKLSLHGSLFLWSAKVTKPQRFLCVLCSTRCFFFSCTRKLCFRLRRLHVCHTLWSSEVKHTTSNRTDVQLQLKSWFPEQHLQPSSFIRLLSHHVRHTRCHTFPLAHMLCMILVLTASLKQQDWWMLGYRCTSHSLVFSIVGAFVCPSGCFFGFHCCAPLLCHRNPVL